MIMAKSKEEAIFIKIDDQIIELVNEEKEIFLTQRAKDHAEYLGRIKKEESKKSLMKSAYEKLGLTEEEINAIL
jgi:hypothetical protein